MNRLQSKTVGLRVMTGRLTSFVARRYDNLEGQKAVAGSI